MNYPGKVGSRMSYEAVNEYYGYTAENAVVQERPADYVYFTHKDEDNDQLTQFEADYYDILQDPFYHTGNSIGVKLGHIHDELSDAAGDTDRNLAHDLKYHLELLTAVNKQVADCSKDPENDDERRAFVAATFAQYQEAMPFIADEEWDDNFDRTVSFLSFYENVVTEKAQANSWAEKISSWRALYADYIEAGNSVSEQSVARAALAVRSVPIFIVDPLTTLINKAERGNSEETLGVFTADKRTVHIDPFTIQSINNPQYPDIGTRGTLIHELEHVITDTHYTLGKVVVGWNNDRSDVMTAPGVVTQKLWPAWWREGMTEKRANLANSDLASKEELELAQTHTDTSETNNDKELRWRKARAGSIHESLTDEKTLELRKINAASYRGYRLLIDAFFAKLDWQAAGLDAGQIEGIATLAFSEVPEDGSSNRMRFIAAVNKAAHPGFFMKLQHGVDLHGVQPITDMLLDPKFDPHDPQAYTFIATTRYRDYLNDDSRLAAVQERIKRMREWGVTPSEANIRQLHQLQKNAGRSVLLADAIKGQRTLLQAYQRPTPESQLIDSIFGSQAKKRQQDKAEAAHEAIRRWREELADIAAGE